MDQTPDAGKPHSQIKANYLSSSVRVQQEHGGSTLRVEAVLLDRGCPANGGSDHKGSAFIPRHHPSRQKARRAPVLSLISSHHDTFCW